MNKEDMKKRVDSNGSEIIEIYRSILNEMQMDDKGKYEILGWFASRCGDVIKNADYQRLFPEFARVLGAGDDCKTTDDAIAFMEKLKT